MDWSLRVRVDYSSPRHRRAGSTNLTSRLSRPHSSRQGMWAVRRPHASRRILVTTRSAAGSSNDCYYVVSDDRTYDELNIELYTL